MIRALAQRSRSGLMTVKLAEQPYIAKAPDVSVRGFAKV